MLEEITSIMSIDWGLNHCVFVDNVGRVFSYGSNRHGKTGLAGTFQRNNFTTKNPSLPASDNGQQAEEKEKEEEDLVGSLLKMPTDQLDPIAYQL